MGEKIKEETATTEKQKGKCGIKQLGVLWVGTPIDEAKVDLSVLRPVPLVRHLKYATHHPHLSLLKYFFFRLHGCCPCDLESDRVNWTGRHKYARPGALVRVYEPRVSSSSRQLCSVVACFLTDQSVRLPRCRSPNLCLTMLHGVARIPLQRVVLCFALQHVRGGG